MNLIQTLETPELPKSVRDFAPEWGVVLGSGLGALVDNVDSILALPYEEIPGLPVSTVAGHAGRFVFGKLAGARVVIAQGRVHLYEGRTAGEVTAHVRLMAGIGVKRLILTNAAGTLNPAHPPGGWMMLSDHLNLTGATPLLGAANFIDMSEVYSSTLRARFRSLAIEEAITLHEGVYASLLGPQYETPAEIRMLQRLGAHAVRMSTALEAIQARALGLEVAGFSCLTNWGAGLGQASLDHQEVLDTGREAGARLVRLLRRALTA